MHLLLRSEAEVGNALLKRDRDRAVSVNCRKTEGKTGNVK